MKKWSLFAGIVFCLTPLVFSQPLGIFTGQVSVGDDAWSGQASFANDTYEILGSGNDIWGQGQTDGFYFVYKTVTGDFIATCDAVWGEPEIPGADPQGDYWKKIGWMARDSVDDPEDAGAAHASALIIRDLYSNLVARLEYEGESFDIFFVDSEDRGDKTSTIQLKREGNTFTMFRGLTDGSFIDRGSVEIEMAETILVGLVVTSHDTNAIERGLFSNVSIKPLTAISNYALY
jgi:hypothetical protein